MGRLENKVAVVTGAGSGIGRATALRLAYEGARVIAVDISGAEVETAQAIVGGAIARHTDVARADDLRALMEEVRSRFGRLDILVNNAGIEGEQAPTAECSEENFDRVIAINLKGVFLGMKYGLPLMLATGGGAIINMASVAGLTGFAGIPAYCAAKGGVIQLTKTAALEYATQNIRVNAICPGVIATPMIERFTHGAAEAQQALTQMEPLGRIGTPDEIAAAVAFLASDDASFITGAVLPVDGGFVAK
jgi:NAD(P)-dependent dehydrogenase (short-subunit alcohol dehydrogenase family)